MAKFMKAAVLTGTRSIQIQERTVPEIEVDEVLINIKACGICGSDLAYYQRGKADIPPPIVLGHEFTGKIVEMGEIPRKQEILQIGERVVVEPVQSCGACWTCKRAMPNLCVKPVVIGVNVDGGFAEYCKVNWKYLHPLPENVSFEEGAFAEPLACAINGTEKAKVSPGDFCAVIGPGPIGLMTAQYLKASGASKVALVGTRDYRLKAGSDLGMDFLINVGERDSKYYADDPVARLMEITDNRGADIIIVTTGNVEANQMAMEIGGPRSRTVLFGGAGYGTEDYVKLFLWKGTLAEKEIFFSWLSPYTFPKALKSISSGFVKVKPLITHIFPLEEAGKAIETVEKRLENVIKAQIKP